MRFQLWRSENIVKQNHNRNAAYFAISVDWTRCDQASGCFHHPVVAVKGLR